ncbi:MAG: hypothetical protein ACI8V2_003470 [Candidatus Latescibacterota bacterium]|jgi:hypothetical protein
MAASSGENRRRADRYDLNVPMQLNGQAYHDIELVDISETGLQIRTGDFDIFQGRGYKKNTTEKLKICMNVRLAWAEPDENGGFVTGWAFEVDNNKEDQIEDPQHND